MSMTYVLAAALAVFQNPQPPAQPLPPSPVTRIEITPRTTTIVAGDSMRLQARALDANGRPVTGAQIFFTARGGTGEGAIDSTGFLIGSTIGKMPIGVSAILPGVRPYIDSLEIRIVPGPAARVDVMTKARRLVVGQQLIFNAIPHSAKNDRARERVTWQSSKPSVLTVDDVGLV